MLFCFARLNYAFGVPGTLKNALDRTVGTVAFSDKPVVLITASSVGDKAHASQQQTFIALSTQMIDSLLISYVRMKLNEQGEIVDGDIFRAVQSLVDKLIGSVPGITKLPRYLYI